jgi:hypothetical protein
MPNVSTGSLPGAPDPHATQIIYMSILTTVRNGDFSQANIIVNDFVSKYGTMLPLLVCAASFGNSILDAYAEVMEEEPEVILQGLALQQLQERVPENPTLNREQRRKKGNPST